MAQKPLYTFTNKEDGMESYVFKSTNTGYNITLRDLDSGEMVSAALGANDLGVARDKARRAAGLPANATPAIARGDRFDLFGETWVVTDIRGRGRKITIGQEDKDRFGKVLLVRYKEVSPIDLEMYRPLK